MSKDEKIEVNRDHGSEFLDFGAALMTGGLSMLVTGGLPNHYEATVTDKDGNEHVGHGTSKDNAVKDARKH